MKTAFQNSFGIEKILKLNGATSILMRSYRDNLTDLLVNKKVDFTLKLTPLSPIRIDVAPSSFFQCQKCFEKLFFAL